MTLPDNMVPHESAVVRFTTGTAIALVFGPFPGFCADGYRRVPLQAWACPPGHPPVKVCPVGRGLWRQS